MTFESRQTTDDWNLQISNLDGLSKAGSLMEKEQPMSTVSGDAGWWVFEGGLGAV